MELFDNLAQKQDWLDVEFDLLFLPNKLTPNLVEQNKHLLSHSFFMLRIWA